MNYNVMQPTLLERHRQERDFHDWVTRTHGGQDFYKLGATKHIFQRLLEHVGDISGKFVLDLGCGTGWTSAVYAKRGARVAAVDISPESLRVAKGYIEARGLGGHVSMQIMAAEKLGYASQSFDHVFGVSVLHHTDLSKSVPEVSRVLRPGGTAIFIEPLIHNPIVQFYRRKTPSLRSPLERPLSLQDIGAMKAEFSHVEHEGFYLLSLLAFFWNKIIRCDGWFASWLEALVKVDRCILRKFPGLGKYCWMTIMILRK